MRVRFRYLEQGETDWERILGIGVITPLVALLIVSLHYELLPRCLFAQITGVPCPTCGSAHAALLIFEGRFFQAFLRQPLMSVAMIAGLVFCLYSWMVVLARGPRLRIQEVRARTIIWIGMLVVLANWLYLICCGIKG